ncbi:MAG: ParB/RepB/Spo0J family partition protein [Actinobacteria bacterium]|nr:MAG: ParB/RepB/Spo0J family partition protein [Actinomycetota bacterium]
MASARRGIGRGLSAILPEAEATATGELRELPVSLIKPNPSQPRTNFDEEALAALAASIETSGVVQPLLVRPLPDGSYELVAGERRWRAAQQAGVEKVPAVVRDQEEAERLQAALIENMVREDLNPVEEARACDALVRELGLTKEELARRVGRSRPAVSNLIRLLELPDEALDLLQSGDLSEGHGKALLGVPGNDVRRRLARDAARAGWSVRETEERVRLASQPKTKPTRAPVDPDAQAALRDVADALEEALGHEVTARAKGNGIVVELPFDDVREAHALARRLRKRSA